MGSVITYPAEQTIQLFLLFGGQHAQGARPLRIGPHPFFEKIVEKAVDLRDGGR